MVRQFKTIEFEDRKVIAAMYAGGAIAADIAEKIGVSRTTVYTELMERIYSLDAGELRKLDECLAVSFGMTHQEAQEGAQGAQNGPDDIFHHLTRKGLSVAVCPLPVLNQVNITVTDGKSFSMTRNVAAPGGGIVSELTDMKDALTEVTP